MGIIVCQHCDSTIEHFEDQKVSTLYSKCDDCCNQNQEKTNK